MRKSLLFTYLLWLPLGVFGFHRFYLGRWLTGLLYLFTGGLLGVGWVLDFFLIPGMVANANYLEATRRSQAMNVYVQNATIGQMGYSGPTMPPMHAQGVGELEPRRKSKREQEIEVQQKILHFAKANGGELSVTAVAMATGLPLEEAEERLKKMLKSKYVDVGFRNGVVVYRFLEFLPAEAEQGDETVAKIRKELATKLKVTS